jgi:hypothetical protein
MRDGDAFFVVNLGLDKTDGIGSPNVKRDGCAFESLREDLCAKGATTLAATRAAPRHATRLGFLGILAPWIVLHIRLAVVWPIC